MEEIKEKKKINWFIVILFSSCFIVIFSSFYFFFFKKNFDFIIEVACDPTKEECSRRDCSLFECPPNNLSVFKRYSLKAKDFGQCPNENCEVVCKNGEIECSLIQCEEDPGFGESCIFTPNNPLNLEEEENNNE